MSFAIGARMMGFELIVTVVDYLSASLRNGLL